jgi:hypothetical protein
LQSDKKSIYDGRNNTYTFENNGERQTLLQLKGEGAVVESSNKVLMMSEKGFFEIGKRWCIIYIA